jgi:hypothetical protein
MGKSCKICNDCDLKHLSFHHKDKTIKKSNLSVATFRRNRDFLIEEVKKCILLCHNCHMEVEHGIHLDKEREWDDLIHPFNCSIEELYNRLPFKKDRVIYYCQEQHCSKELKFKALRCSECNKINQYNQRKADRPSHKQLLQEIEDTNYSAVGRKYGVSDNTIRKWKRIYEKGLETTPPG